MKALHWKVGGKHNANYKLKKYYQIRVSIRKYLQKYGMYNEKARNADAVVLFSNSAYTGSGMF